MKILFWILAIASVPVGIFMTVASWLVNGLGLYSSAIGKVICLAGMLSVVVSIVCAVLGIIKLRKGDVKKAVILALVGVVYSGAILAGIYIDEAVDTMRMEQDIAARGEQVDSEEDDPTMEFEVVEVAVEPAGA